MADRSTYLLPSLSDYALTYADALPPLPDAGYGPVTAQTRAGYPNAMMALPYEQPRPADYMTPVAQTFADINPIVQGIGAGQMAADAVRAAGRGRYAAAIPNAMLAGLTLLPGPEVRSPAELAAANRAFGPHMGGDVVSAPPPQQYAGRIAQLDAMRGGAAGDVPTPIYSPPQPTYYLDGTGRNAMAAAASAPIAGGIGAEIDSDPSTGFVDGAAGGAALGLGGLGVYGLARGAARAVPRNAAAIRGAEADYGTALDRAIERQSFVNADARNRMAAEMTPETQPLLGYDPRAVHEQWRDPYFRAQGRATVARAADPRTPTETGTPQARAAYERDLAQRQMRADYQARAAEEASSPAVQRSNRQAWYESTLRNAIQQGGDMAVPSRMVALSRQTGIPLEQIIAEMEQAGMHMRYLNWKTYQGRVGATLSPDARAFIDALRQRDRAREAQTGNRTRFPQRPDE